MRSLAVGAAALALTGCLQILGVDYSYPCEDAEGVSECVDCAIGGPCKKEWATCLDNPECSAMIYCMAGCTSCDSLCHDAHPNGSADYDAYNTCEDAACGF